jgi:hypothetical protein
MQYFWQSMRIVQYLLHSMSMQYFWQGRRMMQLPFSGYEDAEDDFILLAEYDKDAKPLAEFEDAEDD